VGDEAVRLGGGTLSEVWRVGATVRRSARPWSGTVQRLLAHLRRSGFDLAPEPGGFDHDGREVLGFISGQTVGWDLPWPDWVRSDRTLAAVGSALRRLHEATGEFALHDPGPWPPPLHGLAGDGAPPGVRPPAVCHNDLAPYNVVFGAGGLSGIIDWDMARPGDPLSDLAFVAWQWVPLHGPFVSELLGWSGPPGPDERGRRLRLLADAYGLDERRDLLPAVEARIAANRSTMAERAAAGDAAYQALVDAGHLGGMDEAASFLGEVGERLGSYL
jgi:hypothetical protein